MADVVRWLDRLVAFPTVSDRPLLDCAAVIAERCEALGFRIERFTDPKDAGKCTVVATLGPPGTEGLTLSGHMDVVPVEGQDWTTDPFRLSERHGALYGRGTADMKGFIAATLVALERIPSTAYTRELALIWTHDEEVGCKGSAALVDALRETERPFPRATLIGEPTSFRILRMHPGHVAVEIEVTGRSAHSSRPDLGTNAIEGAADVIERIRGLAAELALEPAALPEMERPIVPVNIATIHGGVAINLVPDRCVIQLGYRPLPGQAPDAVFERLRDRLAPLGDGVRARILRITPGMLTPPGTPLEQALQPHSPHGQVGAAGFATDGGNLAALGLEPLIFGPGSIDVAHRADEHIPLDELHRAVDIIEALVRQRCCT